MVARPRWWLGEVDGFQARSEVAPTGFLMDWVRGERGRESA